MSMLPRLKPTTSDNLIVQIAIVRPSPIQGDMAHPYLQHRERLEPVHYPKPPDLLPERVRWRARGSADRIASPGLPRHPPARTEVQNEHR